MAELDTQSVAVLDTVQFYELSQEVLTELRRIRQQLELMTEVKLTEGDNGDSY